MESDQIQARSKEKEPSQKETRIPRKISRKGKGDSVEFALQAIRAGMSLYDFPPEEAAKLASLLGNQTILSLFGGGEALSLFFAPSWEEPCSLLPVNEMEIRWPALAFPPSSEKLGKERGRPFPVDRLRSMGRKQVAEYQ